MEKLLELVGVNKHFGGVIAAKDVNMDVYPGEIHGLIGPNGAGKTTLLNLISGIMPVDSGTITFLGKDVTSIKPHNRARMGMGRTFQTPRFLKRADIEENILLAIDLAERQSFLKSFFSPRSKDFIPQLDELTRTAQFSFYLENDINSLTYGQRKMLEIIRSMLTNPKLILVDEPAAGLNNAEIIHMVELLRIAAFQRSIGIVLIEHSMDMILDCCHNITVLNFGEVIACGSPEQISSDQAVITAYLGRERHA